MRCNAQSRATTRVVTWLLPHHAAFSSRYHNSLPLPGRASNHENGTGSVIFRVNSPTAYLPGGSRFGTCGRQGDDDVFPPLPHSEVALLVNGLPVPILALATTPMCDTRLKD